MVSVRPRYVQSTGGIEAGAPIALSRVPCVGELVIIDGDHWRVDIVTHTPGDACAAHVHLSRLDTDDGDLSMRN